MLRITLITFLLLVLHKFSAAQVQPEPVAMAQSLFSKTKKVLVSAYIGIENNNENAAFWNLYDKYEAKRKAIIQERYYLLREYSDQYAMLDNANASRLAGCFMENTAKTDKLNKQYFKKFKKLVGGKQAATLFQIEWYIQTAMQANVHTQIPIIGELQRIDPQNGIYHF